MDHPVSKAHRALWEAWREGLRDRLEEGCCVDGDLERGLIRHARVVGCSDTIKQLLDMDYPGLVGALE